MALVQPLQCGTAFVTTHSDTMNGHWESHCPTHEGGQIQSQVQSEGTGTGGTFCIKTCGMQNKYNLTFKNPLPTYPALFHRLRQTSTLSPTLDGNYRSQCFVKVSTGQKCGGQGRHKKRQVSGREAQQIYFSMCAVTWKYERKPIWRIREKVIIVLHLPEVGNLTENVFGQKVWPRDNKLRGNQQPLLVYLLLGLSTPVSWPSNRSPEHWETGVLWPSFREGSKQRVTFLNHVVCSGRYKFCFYDPPGKREILHFTTHFGKGRRWERVRHLDSEATFCPLVQSTFG